MGERLGGGNSHLPKNHICAYKTVIFVLYSNHQGDIHGRKRPGPRIHREGRFPLQANPATFPDPFVQEDKLWNSKPIA